MQVKGCPMCSEQLDTQVHSLKCGKEKEQIKIKGRIRDMFKEEISVDISQTLMKMSKSREDYIQNRRQQIEKIDVSAGDPGAPCNYRCC